jgi:carbon-monoxide dehydrogenase medium subunit
LLAEILVPAPAANSRSIYFKHVPRGSIDLAIVNLAVVLSSDPHTGLCRDIKIAMGAVGATPLRAKKTEELLRSKKIDNALIEKAAVSASEEANPRAGSIRGSVRYKKAMIKVLLKRALKALTA